MSIKASINKLEAKAGGKSTRHYLSVRATYGEHKQAAIDR